MNSFIHTRSIYKQVISLLANLSRIFILAHLFIKNNLWTTEIAQQDTNFMSSVVSLPSQEDTCSMLLFCLKKNVPPDEDATDYVFHAVGNLSCKRV